MTPPRRRTPAPESLPVIVEPPPRPGRQPCDTGNPRCGAPARLYAAGWRCDRHRPRTYRPE